MRPAGPAPTTATLWPVSGTLRLADDLEPAFLGDVVDDVALEPADRDRLALVRRGADGFAFVGADPAADLGERVGLVEDLDAEVVVALAHRGDVVGDVHMRGAGGDAEPAFDAAVGFEHRLFAGVAGDDLVEIVDPRLGRQFAHLGAREPGEHPVAHRGE